MNVPRVGLEMGNSPREKFRKIQDNWMHWEKAGISTGILGHLKIPEKFQTYLITKYKYFVLTIFSVNGIYCNLLPIFLIQKKTVTQNSANGLNFSL